MPFQGNGLYAVPPAYNPVVTGTLVSSTAFNETMLDISQALSNCLTRDGQGAPTQDFSLGGMKLIDIANGTFSQPSIVWAGNDGISRSAPGGLDITIQGSQVGGWNSSGYQGAVGATSPAPGTFQTLQVLGGTTFQTSPYVSGADARVRLLRNTNLSGQVSVDFLTQAGLGWQLFSQAGSYDLSVYSSYRGLVANWAYDTGLFSVAAGLGVGTNVTIGGTLLVAGTSAFQSAVVITGDAGGGYSPMLELQGPGGRKYFRIDAAGSLQIVNSANTAVLATLTDAGDLFVSGVVHAAGFAT